MRTIKFLTWALSLVLAAGMAQAQGDLVLKLNLQPESNYVCTTEIQQTVIQMVNDEEQTLNQNMLLVWDYDVLSRDDAGNAEIKLTYKRVSVKQDYGYQQTEYDSDNPPEYLDPSMKSMASLIGTQLRVWMKPDGEVLKIEGVDAMLDNMIKSMELPESPDRDNIISNLKQQFGEDAMRQQLEQITGFYPDRPVTVGDSWKSTVNMSSGFPMRIISTYTLKSMDQGVAIIEASSQITSDTSTNKIAMGPLTMAYDIKGGQAGTIRADEDTGLPVNSSLNLNFSGTVTVSGIPDQEPTTYPISATGTVTISFTKQ